MSDMFNGHYNLLNGTSNVVVNEWTLNLNMCLENLSFKIASSSIIMHSHYLETSFYVPMFMLFSNISLTM
jgi:hypothetical protein